MLGLRSQPVNFKEVFTNKKLQFHINPFINVNQLINNLRPVLARQFGINENEVEIIEAGQYDSEFLPEEAPALVPSDTKLCHKWGEKLQNLAFYVRRRNYLYPEFEANRRQREINRIPIINTSPVVFTGDCPICLESSLLTRRYTCSHGICSECYSSCQSASFMVCSLCRASV